LGGQSLGFRAITPVFDGADENEIAAELARAWIIDRAWSIAGDWAWDFLAENDYDTTQLKDDDEARNLFVVAWLSDLGYDEAQLATDEIYARRSVAREWLRSRDWDPEKVFPARPGDFAQELVGRGHRLRRRDLCP
jgi:DNA-directed RNA polymerase subunit beta